MNKIKILLVKFGKVAEPDPIVGNETRTRNSWLRFASLHNFSQQLLSLLFGR
ncbi:MAG: hypothetical protein HRT38_00245 [Alteromonadaceae bacterium]|nr:hypothetical protein [Alteromonadaceae bacterium]